MQVQVQNTNDQCHINRQAKSFIELFFWMRVVILLEPSDNNAPMARNFLSTIDSKTSVNMLPS